MPDAITNANASIDTTKLGQRTAFWSPSGCDIASYFRPQELVLNIALCGDWAGQASTLASTGCAALTGTNTCYSTYVMDSSNYANAYFEIQYIKVYSTLAATNASAVSATATQASSTSKATTASSGSNQLSVSLWGAVGAFAMGLFVSL